MISVLIFPALTVLTEEGLASSQSASCRWSSSRSRRQREVDAWTLMRCRGHEPAVVASTWVAITGFADVLLLV